MFPLDPMEVQRPRGLKSLENCVRCKPLATRDRATQRRSLVLTVHEGRALHKVGASSTDLEAPARRSALLVHFEGTLGAQRMRARSTLACENRRMTTPVHPTSETGSLGEDMAAVIFQQIRWAPPVKVRQDIGTDLVTFARDTAAPETQATAYDLGAPVLMQVKSSPTEYLKPANKRHDEPGWWFAESDTYHFDHWLSFGLPYLLVLIDTANQVAYWAEVNGQAIVTTGKGRKIFVPAAQKVDADSLDNLNKIAVARRRYDLQGVAWTGKLNDLGPADRLRYALVMPRLVAPHPNREPDRLTFEEAAAMLMRNRGPELAYRADHRGACPKPGEWVTHREWGWRFVGALYELLHSGSSTGFPRLAEKARHRFERDACTVIQACAAYTSDQAQAAAELLTPSKYTKPADRGWMRAQFAALMLELDKPMEASKAAQEALFAMNSLEGDLTVDAIRGGAAAILYATAGFALGDLAEAVTAQDNAGSWWRAQDVSWALEKDLELRFEGWADSNTTHFASSTARTELSTAAWNAAFTGSWGSWRHLSRQMAQLACTSSTDPVELAGALSLLVFIGEKKAATEAARKMWLDGPVDAITTVVNTVAARPWSQRDEGAAMGLFASAGDLLTVDGADNVVDRILDTLKTGGDTRMHGGGWTYRWAEVDSALLRLLDAASIKSHRACADLITEQFTNCSTSVANALVRIAHGLATSDLATGRITNLVTVAKDREDHYGLDLLEVLGPVSDAALAELRKRAEDGNPAAFRSLLVAGSDDHDDYLELGRSAARTVKQMVINARGKDGTASFAANQNDQLHDLALAALNTGDTRLWKAVTDALEAGVIQEAQLQEAVRLLARKFPDLPVHVQRKLRRLAPNLKGSNLGFSLGRNEFDAAAVHLRIAAGTVSDTQVEATLLRLRATDPLGFVNTLASWNGEHKLPFLATMAVDVQPRVRSQAAFSLIEHAHRFPADEQRAASVLRTALGLDEGCSMADAVAQGLTAYPSETFNLVAAALHRHPSALIRSRFFDHARHPRSPSADRA
ncbi:MAG: DUF4365 domain-containing protein [Nocardioidaceae bacterium]